LHQIDSPVAINRRESFLVKLFSERSKLKKLMNNALVIGFSVVTWLGACALAIAWALKQSKKTADEPFLLNTP